MGFALHRSKPFWTILNRLEQHQQAYHPVANRSAPENSIEKHQFRKYPNSFESKRIVQSLRGSSRELVELRGSKGLQVDAWNSQLKLSVGNTSPVTCGCHKRSAHSTGRSSNDLPKNTFQCKANKSCIQIQSERGSSRALKAWLSTESVLLT